MSQPDRPADREQTMDTRKRQTRKRTAEARSTTIARRAARAVKYGQR